MLTQKKLKVVLRSGDSQTIRELRGLMGSWCDVQTVQDLRSIEAVCAESLRQRITTPLALMVDAHRASSAALMGAEAVGDEWIEFLEAVRQQHPAMRRVLIVDGDDLSVAIKGLHTGVVDSLLHRPFDLAGILTALRAQKQQSNQSSDGATRTA